MSNLGQLEQHYEELIYQLLPQLYRSRDSQGELRKFVEMFGHELARLRANIDQLQQDFFIDSCQEWVIPYIGDLVGTTVLFNSGADNRTDVKNTIHWRRQKGTLAGLEDIAAQIGHWGALAANSATGPRSRTRGSLVRFSGRVPRISSAPAIIESRAALRSNSARAQGVG